MSETHPQSSADFDQEAADRSRRFFAEMKALGQPYYQEETLGDLVVDGRLHPYVFLERYNNTKNWLKAKGLLMTIYKDYKTAKDLRPNEKWISPLTQPTFNAEKYGELGELTRSMIEEYIDYLMQSDTATQPLDLEAHGLVEAQANSKTPAEPIMREDHQADDLAPVDNR